MQFRKQYPMRLSSRMDVLSESQTLQMAKLSRELAGKGYDVINLSLGEPDFDTPAHIKEAACKAIGDGYTHYPPVAGYADLRKAVSDKLKRENGLDFTPEEVVVSTGAKQALANLMFAVLSPGDEVLLPAPYWVSYTEMIKLAGGVIKTIPTDIKADFKITPAQLRAAITPAVRMFVYSSPSNPTGSVYTRDELAGLAEVLAGHEILVVSDEIYEHITFSGKHESIAQFPELKGKVAVVNGVSKSFAMTGWRIGYMAGPREIAAACEKIQGQFTSGASSVSQRAALAALEGGAESANRMRDIFRKRRDLLVGLLENIPGFITNTPAGAFYLFPDVRHYFGKTAEGKMIRDADDLCMYLLHDAQVAIVTGKAFGDDHCVRISYSLSEDKLEEAARRIRLSLEKLR